MPRWQLRSKHFVYGMPLEKDDRHQMQSGSATLPGISVIVKEGFVVGHWDAYKVPAWVMLRWTENDYRQSEAERGKEREFADDDELPTYAKGGTNLDNATSGMQRGHMARQEDNKAYGADNVQEGCEMSNIAPQSGTLNNGPWNELEEMHRRVVADPASGIKAIWVISGTVFTGPPAYVGNKIAVPDAFYKVIGWFDRTGEFQCRGYLLKQADGAAGVAKYLTTVRQIEIMTGLDFFSELPDEIEDAVEREAHTEPWR